MGTNSFLLEQTPFQEEGQHINRVPMKMYLFQSCLIFIADDSWMVFFLIFPRRYDLRVGILFLYLENRI